jgi:hypothetical protein
MRQAIDIIESVNRCQNGGEAAMRKLITLFMAFGILAVPFVLKSTAQAETKKETAIKKCAAKRDGCYARCNARYQNAGGNAVMRCGIRTCDFQYGNCKKGAETLSAQ